MGAIYHGHLATAIRLLEMEPFNPSEEKVVEQFWKVSDYVLEKMSGRQPEEDIYKDWEKLMELLGPLGFGFDNDRLSASIRLHMMDVVETLARVKARDQMGCSMLMHLCLASWLPPDILDLMLRKVIGVIDMDEINATDISSKTAVDFALSESNIQALIMLQVVGATDINEKTVFQRAVMEDAAYVIQSLLIAAPGGEDRQKLKASVEEQSSDAAWKTSKSGMWVVKQGEGPPRATFCTCFLPSPDTRLKVRYPVVFGRSFPKVDALTRAAEASSVLEKWRSQEGLVPMERQVFDLTGYDGYDVWRGAVTCWICKRIHDQKNKNDSWIGPLTMRIQKEKEDLDTAFNLKIFMHHDCVKNLNMGLGGKNESTENGFAAKFERAKQFNRFKSYADEFT